MKNRNQYLSKILIISLFIIGSCSSPEPKESNFTVTIKNESGNILSIRGFNTLNELIINETLNNLESNSGCNYLSEVFQGYSSAKCDIDSLVIDFNNGAGYICVDRTGSINTNCFLSDLNPVSGSEGFNNIGENRYEFVITEEDFDNAHDLPE